MASSSQKLVFPNSFQCLHFSQYILKPENPTSPRKPRLQRFPKSGLLSKSSFQTFIVRMSGDAGDSGSLCRYFLREKPNDLKISTLKKLQDYLGLYVYRTILGNSDFGFWGPLDFPPSFRYPETRELGLQLHLRGPEDRNSIFWILRMLDVVCIKLYMYVYDYVHIFIYIWISFWFTFKERFQTPIPQNHWTLVKSTGDFEWATLWQNYTSIDPKQHGRVSAIFCHSFQADSQNRSFSIEIFLGEKQTKIQI